MLDANLKTQLKSYLENLKTPVELQGFFDDSDKSRELKALIDDIAQLSSLVSIKESTQTSNSDSNERTPSMLVRSVETGSEIRFAGIPLGHEFTSLVLALLHSGGHPMKIDAELIEQIRSLESSSQGPLHFETFVSLSCQNCPDVVQAFNMMAAINPNIHHTMIDGAVYSEEASERNVLAVPATFLNGQSFAQGRISLSEILNKVDVNSAARQAEKINQKETFDLLIVGGGPAGASAAIYSSRKGIRTGIVADRFGGQVQDTMAIENFISVKATEGPKLVAGLEEHVKEYDVDIMNNQRATAIRAKGGVANLVEIELENGATLQSRSIIIATGARWREMNVPGEQEYRGRGVAYCPHCDGPLFKGKSVAVIGGGNSGIEAAIDLAGIVQHVTVLEFDSKLRADEVLQRKAKSMGNIDIITNAQTTEVLGDGNKVNGLQYTDRQTGDTHQLDLAGVFVQIGLIPNADFAKGALELNERGEIVVDHHGSTSMPGVFAAGDVANVPYKQIIIAMGNGANAALSAFDYLIRTPIADQSNEDVAA